MSLKEDVLKLKKEKNAIILTHYYVDGAVQDVADFVGDSYALAKKAKNTDADIIVFAGVKFMGESAKMLNPDKKVGEDYTVRIVDNERDWIEKILISDSGYDDRIMELYKLLVLSQYEDADNVNGLYYWNIQNFENPHYVMVLDEKESDKMHFMPFHEGVYKQVEEVFLSDIKQDYIVDASWAVSNTK